MSRPASSSTSAAERCATDVVALVFSFLALREALPAVLTCRQWFGAAAKEKPRGLHLQRVDLVLASLGRGGESEWSLRRHVGAIGTDKAGPLRLASLRQLHSLPSLTALGAMLHPSEVERLVEEQRRSEGEGGGESGGQSGRNPAPSLFPTQLRALTLRFSGGHTCSMRQLLVDALSTLTHLRTLCVRVSQVGCTAEARSLSLAPLLLLPHLASFEWFAPLGPPQLAIVKQLPSLRRLCANAGVSTVWNAERLGALCRPPRRLQQLEEIDLRHAAVGAQEMAELVLLPSLTALRPACLLAGAFPFLPRLACLRSLRLNALYHSHPHDGGGGEQHREASHAALRSCPLLTEFTIEEGECDEEFLAGWLQSLPHLHTLRLVNLLLPSGLAFLRHATPLLREVELRGCDPVQASGLLLLGRWTSHLTALRVVRCLGLRLDEQTRAALTPPSVSMPHLVEFEWQLHPQHVEEDEQKEQDDREDFSGIGVEW